MRHLDGKKTKQVTKDWRSRMKRIDCLLKGGLLAAVAIAAMTLAHPGTASAQGLFSWFSSSGKEMVTLRTRQRPGTIIVSFGDRKLYKVLRRGQAIAYPIAVPRRMSRWSGTLHVSEKRVNPGWTPTPTMRRENPKLPAYVPGGHPRNPLGVRALYLGSTMYRIHGTDAPWTIGQAVSKGCIRMYNNDVIDLYKRTRVGTKVVVTWRRFRTGYSSLWSSSPEPKAKRRKAVRKRARSSYSDSSLASLLGLY